MIREKLFNTIRKDKNTPVVVYHLGVDAGFFSEYNNMILCLVYCLENNLKFSIYSRDANFRLKDGWNDFFIPFCEENKCPLHSLINKRPDETFRLKFLNTIDRIMISTVRKLFRNTLLMSDVWIQARSLDIHKQYDIPSISASGNLRDICRKLIELTWVYTPTVQQEVEGLRTSLKLPEKYIGLHIRGGDKFIEASKQEEDVYIKKAMELTDCREAFVLTDDYTVIERLLEKYPEWHFYTLCGQEERGYFHKQFSKQNRQTRAKQLIRLFTSTDIISDGELFIGTFSSNPGMYLGMKMAPKKTYSVDVPEWTIW
ncbi:hypothetical protein [Massilibacteroides sp.]|uniref:hypothetical protein n=1 Tax=Massilibacteroides sp. TaxID=2034766 RepID=UPI0026362144|nr:hypothetical protein [Massilibacteroides sp.]MDD4515372.1 hypothetical protein [Massilibacteroides sp.]